MAEIKSTIDIVMERTRHLVQSPEERRAAEEAEREKRARGFLLGVQENRIEPDDILKTLDEAGDAEEAMRKSLVRVFADAIGLEAENEPVLRALDAITGGAFADKLNAAASLVREYRTQKSEMEGQASDAVISELAAIGITGSALVSAAESDYEFEAAIDKLNADASKRLETLRNQISGDGL